MDHLNKSWTKIGLGEIRDILQNVENSEGQLSAISLTPLFEQAPFSLQGLYSQAVGEMGIAPSQFWQMTAEEVELAYEGYLRRQELTANLTKLAFIEALGGNTTPISLFEDKGYTLGSTQEYNNTFKQLGV